MSGDNILSVGDMSSSDASLTPTIVSPASAASESESENSSSLALSVHREQHDDKEVRPSTPEIAGDSKTGDEPSTLSRDDVDDEGDPPRPSRPRDLADPDAIDVVIDPSWKRDSRGIQHSRITRVSALPEDSSDSIDLFHSSGSQSFDLAAPNYGTAFATGVTAVPLGPGYPILALVKWWNKLQVTAVYRTSAGFLFLGLEFVFILLLALKLEDIAGNTPGYSGSWFVVGIPLYIECVILLVIAWLTYRQTNRMFLLICSVEPVISGMILIILAGLKAEGIINWGWTVTLSPILLRVLALIAQCIYRVIDTNLRFRDLTFAELLRVVELDRRTAIARTSVVVIAISLIFALWSLLCVMKLDGGIPAEVSWWWIWCPVWFLLFAAVVYSMLSLVVLHKQRGVLTARQRRERTAGVVSVFLVLTVPMILAHLLFVEKITGRNDRKWTMVFAPTMVQLLLACLFTAPGDLLMMSNIKRVIKQTQTARTLARAARHRQDAPT